MAAVSVFLSFVPFQILKRTRQHSREIILCFHRCDCVSNPDRSPFEINRMANEIDPDVTDNSCTRLLIFVNVRIGPNGLFFVVNGPKFSGKVDANDIR